jgi:hypothetical protein
MVIKIINSEQFTGLAGAGNSASIVGTGIGSFALIINFLIALSFGTQRLQLVQFTFTTCPLPCLLRPPFLLFLV